MPAISLAGKASGNSGMPSGAQGSALREFCTAGRTILSPGELTDPRELSAQVQTDRTGLDIGGEEPAPAIESELGTDPPATDDDIERIAGAARAAVMAEFAGRIQAARKYLPRHSVRAAVAALKSMRKAALALVKRNAAQQRAARRAAHRPKRPNRSGKTGPPRKGL